MQWGGLEIAGFNGKPSARQAWNDWDGNYWRILGRWRRWVGYWPIGLLACYMCDATYAFLMTITIRFPRTGYERLLASCSGRVPMSAPYIGETQILDVYGEAPGADGAGFVSRYRGGHHPHHRHHRVHARYASHDASRSVTPATRSRRLAAEWPRRRRLPIDRSRSDAPSDAADRPLNDLRSACARPTSDAGFLRDGEFAYAVGALTDDEGIEAMKKPADGAGIAREVLRRARSDRRSVRRIGASRRARPNQLDERTQWSVRSPNGELRDAAAQRIEETLKRPTAKERLRRVEKSLDHGRQGLELPAQPRRPDVTERLTWLRSGLTR